MCAAAHKVYVLIPPQGISYARAVVDKLVSMHMPWPSDEGVLGDSELPAH